MPSQFIHLSCYGAQSGSRRRRHENVFDIIDEAARAPDAIGHLTQPRPPVHLYGLPLQTLKDRMGEFIDVARDRRGARLRRDATVLYAIVASYPIPWRKIGDDEALAYARWREAVLDWLATSLGDALQAVVEHVDEPQPHLHAFAIPPLGPQNRIDHRLHPGHAARAIALGRGESRLIGERAYRDGMRRWQDDFHAKVSSQFGHDRVGPRRKRFRRDVALARQASDHLLERMESTLKHVVQRLEPHPTLDLSKEIAEIETMAGLVREARQRHLNGRADAVLTLEAALKRLGDTGSAVVDGVVGEANLVSDGDHLAWDPEVNDDPDSEAGHDIDQEDDPDPERLDEVTHGNGRDDDPDGEWVLDDDHWEEDPDR